MVMIEDFGVSLTQSKIDIWSDMTAELMNHASMASITAQMTNQLFPGGN